MGARFNHATETSDEDSSAKNVHAVILAAGTSSRFGSSKLLAEYNGDSLLQHAATIASQVCASRTLLIAGADWQKITQNVEQTCRFFAYNESFADGIGSSIALAARVCQKRADAMLLLLADQPLITAEHLRALIDAWSGSKTEIVASAYAGTAGPPVLFADGVFAQLSRMSGDTGARELLHNPGFDTVTVQFEDAATDVDTASDLAALF